MFLIRHGQSYFNLHFSKNRIDPKIEDPELTPLGKDQAAAAAYRLAGVPLTRVIVSPFTRALQTAQPFLEGRNVVVDVMHEVRERAAYVCDIGSPPGVLAERFPHHAFAHLPHRWWNDGHESAEQTISRATEFRTLMAGRTDGATTLLVSHWAFILCLTGESFDNGQVGEYDPTGNPPKDVDWYS